MAKAVKTLSPVTGMSKALDYRVLVDLSPHAFIVVYADDPVFTIAAASKAHAQLTRVNTDTVIGKPIFEIFPDVSEKFRETGVSDLRESFRKVIRTGEIDTLEVIHYDLKASGKSVDTRYWRITNYPLFDEKGSVMLIRQDVADITDEAIAEKKLNRLQKQLDEALSVGKVGTWNWDIKAGLVVGDKNMAEMFGVSPEDAAKGLPTTAFVGGMYIEDQPRVSKETAAVLKTGGVFRSEYRTVRKDGSVRWLMARGRVERNEKGEPVYFPGVLFDITSRKIIENNLSFLAKASAVLSTSLNYKKTLQSIAKLMVPDIADWCGVEILDDRGQLQQVAVAHKDPAKVSWARELRKQQGPPPLDAPTGVPNVLRTGKPEFYPYIPEELIEKSAKNKKELKLIRDLALTSVIIVPLKRYNKTIGAISLITTDGKRNYTKSDLEMAEELASRASLAMTNSSLYEEVRLANEELESRVEARTEELEATNNNLKRSNQELQDFAYVASHDLQEPLRKIQAFGNLLESEYGTALGDGKDYLSRMRSAAARMSALIEDILSFSRVTTKGRPFTLVDLSTIAEEVLGDLEVRIADTRATVDVGALPKIHADPIQMRQLLQNLIANALKFRREGVAPEIRISSTTEQSDSDRIKYCRIEVEDNGLGFDEKYLDRIFAVFQRLHNRDSYEGTGIGLAVCRKIVERHGGSISATSRPGRGSTFIVRLPMRHKKGDSLL